MQTKIRTLTAQNATIKKINQSHRYAKKSKCHVHILILHHLQPLVPSRLLVALGQTPINILRQIRRNHLPKLLDILAINLLGKSKRSINNILVERKEALRNLVGARVLGVEASDKDSGVAAVVELEVDRALGKYGALELLECAGDFGILAGGDEPVF